MKVLYVGDTRSTTTSRDRSDAISRIGHEVTQLDMWALGGPTVMHPLWSRAHYHTGYRFARRKVDRSLAAALGGANSRFDVAWVNNGELIGRNALQLLHRVAAKVILYTNDDPTGRRDGRRFATVRAALDSYDLCVVVRNENVPEFKAAGARRVMRVFMSCDEVAHRPPAPDEIVPDALKSDICFIGTWMPERGPFMAELLRAKLPLAIWGNRWRRAPEWREIQPAWRGPSLHGRDYVKAIAGAKICLGLLSKGNRDLHTTRSSEIPYAGGLLCAERTNEHQEMYRDEEEAVFWSDARECASICKRFLTDDNERERIRRNGMRRVKELKVGNEDVCRRILEELAALKTEAVFRTD